MMGLVKDVNKMTAGGDDDDDDEDDYYED